MRNQRRCVPVLVILILASAGLACKAASVTTLFATETPTPTDTPTVTSTPTITPSPTPTVTPTPTRTPTPAPTGVDAKIQPDGSTLFIDYDYKFQFTLPGDWAVMPITKEMLKQLTEQLATENPELAADDTNTELLRGLATYTNDKYKHKDFATLVSISIIDDPFLLALPLAAISASLEDSAERGGARVLTHGVNEVDNPSGVEMEFLDTEQNTVMFKNSVLVNTRTVIFISNGKLVVIALTTPKKFSQDLLPLANEMGRTVELLK